MPLFASTREQLKTILLVSPFTAIASPLVTAPIHAHEAFAKSDSTIFAFEGDTSRSTRHGDSEKKDFRVTGASGLSHARQRNIRPEFTGKAHFAQSDRQPAVRTIMTGADQALIYCGKQGRVRGKSGLRIDDPGTELSRAFFMSAYSEAPRWR